MIFLAPKKKEKSAVYNEELAKSNPKYKKTLCHFFEREVSDRRFSLFIER